MPEPPDDFLALGHRLRASSARRRRSSSTTSVSATPDRFSPRCAPPRTRGRARPSRGTCRARQPCRPVSAKCCGTRGAFSELTVGPQHVYNVLLARKARAEFDWDTADLESRRDRRLATWAELVEDRHDELARLGRRPPRVLGAPRDRRRGARSHARVRLERSSRCAVADPAGFAGERDRARDDPRREIQLKAKRARLGHRSALENWNQAPFGGQLDYRWPITQELPGRHRAAQWRGGPDAPARPTGSR